MTAPATPPARRVQCPVCGSRFPALANLIGHLCRPQPPPPAPDYTMPCRHCGGRFLEMKHLLFHPCGKPAKQSKRPKGRPWTEASARAAERAVNDARNVKERLNARPKGAT